MLATVELFDTGDAERLRLALAVRVAVFVEEQGVPPDEEVDAHDRAGATAVHALVRDGDVPIAAGRFYALDEATVQIGRMAVVVDARGRGVGARVLAALIAEAARRGFARAHLHAQVHARGFYERAGFYDDGPQLVDAGIAHQPMSRDLGDPT